MIASVSLQLNAVGTTMAAVAEVKWESPWMAPLRAAGRVVADRVAHGAPVNQALHTSSGALPDVRFVPQSALPDGHSYEAFIARTASVPTRDNLHDLFNGLIWQHYPLTKRRLNQLQAQGLAEQGVGSVRGPLRDACTLFDESGAVLQAPDALWQALLARDWHALFVTHRPLWQQATLTVFGHAVLEQLVRPRKGITAHVLALPYSVALPLNSPVLTTQNAIECIAKIDHWLCAELQSDFMRTKPFTPLPLLGIPGWCVENDDLCFYDDRAVFRPRRLAGAP